MVDKLIRGKIIEIIVVVLLVFLSIPVWQNFEEKVSAAEVTTLDDYNLIFEMYSEENKDRIVVNNGYYINKNYIIYLVLNEKINEDIIINYKTYDLNDFSVKKSKDKYIYALIDDYITANIAYYDIKLDNENIEYSYIFEEKPIF